MASTTLASEVGEHYTTSASSASAHRGLCEPLVQIRTGRKPCSLGCKHAVGSQETQHASGCCRCGTELSLHELESRLEGKENLSPEAFAQAVQAASTSGEWEEDRLVCRAGKTGTCNVDTVK